MLPIWPSQIVFVLVLDRDVTPTYQYLAICRAGFTLAQRPNEKMGKFTDRMAVVMRGQPGNPGSGEAFTCARRQKTSPQEMNFGWIVFAASL